MMTIWEFRDRLGLKKYYNPLSTGDYYYRGIFLTGKFDGVHDYLAGILEVSLRNRSDGTFVLCISTIDDGAWTVETDYPIYVDKLADAITKNFGYALPSEKKFNRFLKEFGLHGEYTG